MRQRATLRRWALTRRTIPSAVRTDFFTSASSETPPRMPSLTSSNALFAVVAVQDPERAVQPVRLRPERDAFADDAADPLLMLEVHQDTCSRWPATSCSSNAPSDPFLPVDGAAVRDLGRLAVGDDAGVDGAAVAGLELDRELFGRRLRSWVASPSDHCQAVVGLPGRSEPATACGSSSVDISVIGANVSAASNAHPLAGRQKLLGERLRDVGCGRP